MQSKAGTRGYLEEHTDIVWVSPLEPDLQIVVFQNCLMESRQQLITLLLAQLIDSFRKAANGIDALPTCDRIGAHYRMYSCQFTTRVLWRAAWIRVQSGAAFVCSFDETVTNE